MPTRLASSVSVLALAGLLLTLAGTGGCAASACTKVRDDRQQFLARQGAGDVAQMVIAVPLATLSQSLTFPLARIKPVTVPLPDLDLPQIPGLGIDLGSLEIGLRSVRVLPAPEGQLGLRITFALRSRGRDVFAIDLEAVVAPQIEPKGGTVRLSLRPQDLLRVRPSLPASEKKKFADFIMGMVPDGAERLVSRGRVEQLADKTLGDFVSRSFPSVRDKLLAGIDTLVDVEIDLPPVPLAKVALRSPGDDLELWLHTTLPAAGLAPGPARAAGSDVRLVQLRMSGGTAAELANQGIARGQIPARYDLEGEPSPTGEFEAGVTWANGERPLRLHAWKRSGVCAKIVFSGTPALRAAGGELSLAVPDARIEKVTGAVKARVAVWYSGLGKQTFAFTQAVAGATEFELLGVDYDATPVRATVAGDDVAIDLSLAPRTAARKR